MPRRFPTWAVAPALVAATAIGCGSAARTGRPVAASATAVTPQVSSTRCVAIGVRNGRHVSISYCVYTLSDGRRFRCPAAFSATPQSVRSLEQTSACTRMKPITFRPSWRRVFAQIENVRRCLSARGLRVIGGPSIGEPPHTPPGPIGELIVINGGNPGLVGFYPSDQAAARFEPTAIRNVGGTGGSVARRGLAIVLWTHPVRAALRTTTEACASA